MSSITHHIDQIAEHVTRYGISGSEPELRRLRVLAQTYGVHPAISPILTDASAPDAVRSRAFARVVVGLRATPSSSASFAAA
jgi:fibrillarin-like rRNA methylase